MPPKSTRSEAKKLHRAAMERQRKVKENIGYDALQRKLDHRLDGKATKKDIVLGAALYIQELQDLLKQSDFTDVAPAQSPVLAQNYECASVPQQSFEPVSPLQQYPEEPGFENWFLAPPQDFQQLEYDFGYTGSLPNPIQAEPESRGIKRGLDQESCCDGPSAKRPSLVEPTSMIIKHGHLFDETTGFYHLNGSVPGQMQPVSNDDPQYSTNYTNIMPQMYTPQNYQY